MYSMENLSCTPFQQLVLCGLSAFSGCCSSRSDRMQSQSASCWVSSAQTMRSLERRSTQSAPGFMGVAVSASGPSTVHTAQ